MIGQIENNNISTVRLFNATNSFNKVSNPTPQELPEQNKEAGTAVKENSILNNIDVEEIKKFATSVGENNLTNEDIKYALRFGRSVLIDYSA